MDGRPTWTDCDEAGDYGVPNVLSPRDLVFRPDNIDETVPHTHTHFLLNVSTALKGTHNYILIGFEGWISVLMASVPGFCILFTFMCSPTY